MKAKRVMLYLLILGIMISLTGCWNGRELTKLAFVLAMGIDRSPKTNEYKVSFQVVIPGSVATGITGGGGTTTPVVIYTGKGNTLFSAIRNASKRVSRQLFFAHLQLVVIGEELAKQGIQDLFDFFERSKEPRLTTLVLVARGSEAKPIISTLTSLEKIPANSVSGKIKMSSTLLSENFGIEIYDVLRGLVNEGEPIINGVKLTGDPDKGMEKSNVEKTRSAAEVIIQGMAIFKNGKLKGWLDNGEARGTTWILNKMKSTIVELDCKKKKNSIGVEIIRSSTELHVEVKNGEPLFHIHIKEEGNLSEVQCPIDLSNVTVIGDLEKDWEIKTKSEVMSAVKAAQKEKSDFLGFGDAVKRADPKLWEKIKTDWSGIFATSKVDVKVDAYIRRAGMRLKPYMSEQKQKEKRQ
ncbi:Ger(x)C family spore germination protein [Paenibacillus prosopidis]|uniref:Spore germination protein KC n=1 Tax=Paenibacillus prosopidis TaxID=630520 RepID=A0A368VLV4_9BACL|nr:Ger(x)C family spore germination protein [Paenibacillus prosopidis]RCW42518.1 spore germination protein KC [Paenibacillus prosopidis]